MGRRKPHTPPASANRPRPKSRTSAAAHWIYGIHAATAAAANPARTITRMVAADGLELRLAEAAAAANRDDRPQVDVIDRHEIAALLPPDSVHQGMVVLAEPLDPPSLNDLMREATNDPASRFVVLDQVSDPRNVGAVLRAAGAFAARAVILQDRHAPAETGVLAKAASGALERVPIIRVTNIARTQRQLSAAGIACIGLDADAPAALADLARDGALDVSVALVLGSEGKGLRRLVRESCDLLARIPIAADAESLNVAAAAAISLYECARSRNV